MRCEAESGNGMDLQEALLKAALEKVKDHFHERVGSIRHPTTGEFPTVVVTGTSLEKVSVQVEGSTEVLKLVKERLGVEAAGINFVATESATPKVFLSYTSADKQLAERVARALQAQGIETWWDTWEIKAGDRLRQKIEDGIAGCTHFVVLLTPSSVDKPWVNAELDAAFMRKLADQCQLIPLRHELDASAL